MWLVIFGEDGGLEYSGGGGGGDSGRCFLERVEKDDGGANVEEPKGTVLMVEVLVEPIWWMHR